MWLRAERQRLPELPLLADLQEQLTRAELRKVELKAKLRRNIRRQQSLTLSPLALLEEERHLLVPV